MADRRSPRFRSDTQNRQSPEGQQRAASPSHSRSAGAEAYTKKRKTRNRKVAARGVVIGVLVVLLAAGSAVAMYMNSISTKLTEGLDQETKSMLSESIQYDDPFYMLLLGVDKSEERMNSDEYGSSDSNFRSDSIILARVDPKGQQITLISLHRDTMTDMSDMNAGTQKLNAAYSLGGPSYMIKCVEKLCGVDISHYAEVDFEQFTSIVDSIGGVTVDLPIDIRDDYSGADFDAGEHTLNGEEALALARSRHAYDNYGDGDIYRAANQRMLIAAIAKKVLTLDVASMTSAVSTLAGGVTTDISLPDILGLAVQFKNIDFDNNVYSAMEPTSGYYTNSTWYEKIDEAAWNTMMERVREGKAPYAEGESDSTSGLIGTMSGSSELTTSGEGSGTGDVASADSSSTEAEYTGTAIVVNVSGVSGAGITKSEALAAAGFTSEATSLSNDATTTKVYYNGSAAKAKAIGAAKTLGVSESNVVENTGDWTTDYDVVVILCSDKA